MAAAIATTNPSKSTVGGGARCSREMEREVASSPLRSAVAQPTSQPALASARLVASAPRLFQPVATISTRIQSPPVALGRWVDPTACLAWSPGGPTVVGPTAEAAYKKAGAGPSWGTP